MSAMLGQACRKGEAKSTYGTGAFILLNTGEELIQSTHGLLSTLAFKLGPDAPTNYAIEGSIAIAGAAVQWLRDGLGLIKTASETEDLAMQVDSTGGIYFVPAFNGLFAPWWRDDACGVCIGITRFTNKFHIARAVLESMCFQVKDVLDSMHKDAEEKGEVKNEKGEFLLRVDGGATVNNLLMQIQGSPVVRPADIDNSSRSSLCCWVSYWGLDRRRNFFFWGKEGKSYHFQSNITRRSEAEKGGVLVQGCFKIF
ncbi:Glycerol kinase [Camellia lanceoleosa]|nr:Glycerol kinase [Camellia lanceoleosa]